MVTASGEQRGYRRQASFIRGQTKGLPPNTRGGGPVRELRPPGSVRGVSSNGYPYRDIRKPEENILARPICHVR